MDIRSALNELAEDIKKEILRRMSSDVGVNPRTGTNTLINSSLYHSVDVYPRSDKTIIFQIADYFLYVVRGWERTHRGNGTFREYLLNIEQWIKRKGIIWKKKNGDAMTQNEMVWALARAMFDEENRYKIVPRPFIAYQKGNESAPNYNVTLESDLSEILPFLDEFFDDWAEDIFNKITKDLDEYFN